MTQYDQYDHMMFTKLFQQEMIFIHMSCDVLDIYPREEDMSSFQNMDRKRMHLEEEEKENSDIKQSLRVLANGITELQASLMKPKERKPNLKDIDQKVDIIIEILRSWDTSSTAYLNSQLYEESGQDVLQNQI